MAMVGNTSAGNTLFSLSYQHDNLTATVSPLLPAAVDPAFVLADIQLTFWPLAEIERALAGSEYSVKAIDGGRQLLKNDQRWVTIHYRDDGGPNNSVWPHFVEFHNEQWGYAYQIETLSIEPLTQVTDLNLSKEFVAQ